MSVGKHNRVLLRSYLRHDLKASITVFFVALPLCLGVALASNVPVASGLIAGIVGGVVVTLISQSPLSVSGPAAGLTAIVAAAILELGSIDLFFLALIMAGLLQMSLGLFRLGGFTHFIPSAVIKGMLTAIGIILISKQIPAVIGYDQPDFWSNELFNIITFKNVFSNVGSLYQHSSIGVILTAVSSIIILYVWKRFVAAYLPYIPASFITVVFGILVAMGLPYVHPELALNNNQFVQLPDQIWSDIKLPQLHLLFSHADIWKTAVIICFVASLESLLSITAIDKLDPQNRMSPPNRELIAQGAGNLVSGLLGGLPITAVIVRSSANVEAGGRSKWSSFSHGVWLLLAVLFAVPVLNLIPYSVLGVILIRTGYNLAKPSMIRAIYRQGREQFVPYLVTVVAILFTDLLVGVFIGIAYAIYFLIKHTYRAGFKVKERREGHMHHFTIELALNVSFLNKKRLIELLDSLPQYAVVEVIGSDSVYIDYDILEIFSDFKSKAHTRHIQLILRDIKEVQTIEVH
jgi:MFS superfamily sulfate permease-like transporter